MTQRLSGLRVRKVSLVKRAAVRDTDEPTEPMRFLVTKEEGEVPDEQDVLKFEGCDDCPPVEAWERELAAEAEKAEGTVGGTAIAALPDSAFAWIKPGGAKKDGKTDNAHRAYPIRTADGKLDRAHVANARARCAQSGTDCPPEVARTLAAASRELGMGGQPQKSEEEPEVPDELSPQEAVARLDAVVDRADTLPAPAAQAVKSAFRALVAFKDDVPPGLLHAASAATGLAIKDAVSKEDLPAAFRELVEQAELSVKKSREESAAHEEALKAEQDRTRTVEFVAKAAAMPRVPVVGANPVEFGAILKSAADSMPAEHFDKLVQILKSTDALIQLSDVLKSVGSERGGRASAMDELEVKTKELQRAEKGLSHSQAMDRVLRDNPELYAAYKAGQ